jgi:hypothetical protein
MGGVGRYESTSVPPAALHGERRMSFEYLLVDAKGADAIQEELRSTSDEVRRLGGRISETAKIVSESESRSTLIESRRGELEQQDQHLRRTMGERSKGLATLKGKFDQGKVADTDYVLGVVANDLRPDFLPIMRRVLG